ncbi:PAAR motif protein [Mesorhizobium sp. LSJC269B00]|uniref:PAAR domain-containing protein n=1 Tax=Mesorhizobium sp. LSJC269B00 TaxID=1287326 RepID=UPI0003CE145C|nr:PAAR domain-containing protein [Mesorhizobium sp. LSJC269B00]ESW93127.1 PAAR motif protein [Mesorhizobium sp. LSJC269B00]
MKQPAAKQGDRVVGIDMHLIQPPGPTSPVIVPHPFDGIIDSGCVDTVKVNGMPAAIVGSVAFNQPHIPMGGTFVIAPRNRGTINTGSVTVSIGGRPAARAGDTALTCNDPVDAPNGKVVATGTVWIGD